MIVHRFFLLAHRQFPFQICSLLRILLNLAIDLNKKIVIAYLVCTLSFEFTYGFCANQLSVFDTPVSLIKFLISRAYHAQLAVDMKATALTNGLQIEHSPPNKTPKDRHPRTQIFPAAATCAILNTPHSKSYSTHIFVCK